MGKKQFNWMRGEVERFVEEVEFPRSRDFAL